MSAGAGTGGTGAPDTTRLAEEVPASSDSPSKLCTDPVCAARFAASGCVKGTPAVPGSTKFTMCEVRRHTTIDDCWLVSNGKVYRLDPDFIKMGHPGASRSILRHAGKDATRDFNFHSHKAKAMWSKYKIGCVVPCGEVKSSCAIM